ncbi:hypothetical protein B0J15DRAFT_554894 [Fusarium solani]|uniref:PD-(D/E)XK nuclease-like domain-containing protein n=1 Tax=Fusarium solani TaxID=169388 RepID=A0A9P9G8W3_FUSSL|nr:uncharacterized protein B0J15DRAFT_554894 [Fusarium solani]KAH7234368.1 hypothetical protein B0J15DRAFT_554894 [Fusarium solani]
MEFFVLRSEPNGSLCVRAWQQLFETTGGGVGNLLWRRAMGDLGSTLTVEGRQGRQGRTLARMSHCWTLFWTTSPARSGNTTSFASISKAYIPKLEVGDYMQAKMVDYYLTLAGGDTMSLAKKRNKVNRSVSIDHTSYEPVQDQPIAVNIETKTPGSSKTEAEAQLSV